MATRILERRSGRTVDPAKERDDRRQPTVTHEPIVRFVGVHKSFGRQHVLKGVDLEFESGKTTVVLGPSGVGKSVILKHIVGLIRPDQGEVWFRDKRVDRMSQKELDGIRQQIGFLFQMAALFDSMTVEENVAFPLIEHTQFTRRERAERVSRALEVVGLDGLQHKMPAELSGGQKKRVGLARAIMLHPALMLYDEPTTGLDPVRSDGINELILQLRRELGVSGIVVTHDLASARKVADQLVMIYDGRIIAKGAFSEIARAEDPRVRHFLAGVYDPREDEVFKPSERISRDPSRGVAYPPHMEIGGREPAAREPGGRQADDSEGKDG